MYWPLNVPRVYTSQLPQLAIEDFSRETFSASPLAFSAVTSQSADGLTSPSADDIGEPYVGDLPAPSLATVPELHSTNATEVGESSSELNEYKSDTNADIDEEPVLLGRADQLQSASSVNGDHAKPEGSLPSRDVIAVKVSRTGLLLATITSAELVVWQTRVSVPCAAVGQLVGVYQSAKVVDQK